MAAPFPPRGLPIWEWSLAELRSGCPTTVPGAFLFFHLGLHSMVVWRCDSHKHDGAVWAVGWAGSRQWTVARVWICQLPRRIFGTQGQKLLQGESHSKCGPARHVHWESSTHTHFLHLAVSVSRVPSPFLPFSPSHCRCTAPKKREKKVLPTLVSA
jgi:hypothetical protein